MSAFIVENRTINEVVSFLYLGFKSEYYKNKLKEMGFDITTDEGREKLGQEMYFLNVMAVRYRYEERADDLIPPGYKYKLEPTNIYQALKSLRCWLYQCSEGNIPETSELYKLMEEISCQLAFDIVYKLKPFEDAEWR